MAKTNRQAIHYHWLAFRKHDLRASVTVFFVALPLCLGVALASGAPVFSGLAAGIIGGLVVTLFSKSALSVSGPAAGLTAICAAGIAQLGSFEAFSVAVVLAGALQFALGLLRMGGFTHFIPSAVIKGMLTAIGVILVSKQVPLLIGYDRPDFWQNELLNIVTFNHAFRHLAELVGNSSAGAVASAGAAAAAMVGWKRFFSKKGAALPASFVAVLAGSITAWLWGRLVPGLAMRPSQFVQLPADALSQVRLPDFGVLWQGRGVWQTAIIVCFVASLETLLSVEAIDKLDPLNRLTPQNRELMAQGAGNFLSGLLGGLPITAVIVRSSANAEAGARTWVSAFLHGLWLLLAVCFAVPVIGLVPFAVLAVVLVRTGYNLAKPSMVRSVYRQGREQFLPFIVTVAAILFTDLLVGVLIGIGYSVYFLVKNTYRAGYAIEERMEGHTRHFTIRLAINVSFLNKRRIAEMLDRIPPYSIVEVNAADSVYIDHDVLEIFQNFKAKAHRKHLQLTLHGVPDVETIELH